MDPSVEKQILGLSDVELVRMLTVDAKQSSAESLAFAAEEARRRGVPIDEAFIPSADPPPPPPAAATGVRPCPLCGSNMCSRDWPSVFWFILGWTFPPVSWLVFLLNKNRWCLNCGLRFRCDAPGPFKDPYR